MSDTNAHATEMHRQPFDAQLPRKRSRRRWMVVLFLVLMAVVMALLTATAYGYRVLDAGRSIFASSDEPVNFFSDFGRCRRIQAASVDDFDSA